MAKQEPSALVEAAQSFHDALADYTRLGELFLKTPLGSVKHLERANTTLAEIAACEERLQEGGKQLVTALGAAREQQEKLSNEVVAHVPEVQARNKTLQDQMAELTAVASSVGELNVSIASQREAVDAKVIAATARALSDRAEQLAESARNSQFEELATQAHSLHQRLQAIAKKLDG
jgi:septal ring factor EnvC (AmiA/AmiB activator)